MSTTEQTTTQRSENETKSDTQLFSEDTSDNGSEDEFHDACDRMVDPGAEQFTEDEILELISAAEASKAEGNKLYAAGKWEEAKQSYSFGLTRAPRRKLPSHPTPTELKDEEQPESSSVPDSASLTEPEKRAACLRAQLNSNIGACCVKLNDHEGAVKACTEALADEPKYVKALQRRASSNETVGSWSALASAESDYTALLDILPTTEQAPVRRALARLKPRLDEAKERETAEMMGKLKDLGNSVLGRFGLSTDNFQFTPNGQGGYGLNFVR